MAHRTRKSARIARTSIGDARALLELLYGSLDRITAANDEPQPQPGFHQAGARLFYVTHRGHGYLVRDADGCVQLTPTPVPADARALEDVAEEEVNAVADAADFLAERIDAGVYHDAGYFYYLIGADVWMLYGTDRKPVRVPCLPPRAMAVDLPPDDITAAILTLETAG